MAAFTRNTPWGRADFVKDIGRGIRCVSTAGHGGYFVPQALMHQIPLVQRRFAATYSGSEQWYEEDCCWASVCLAFPELWPAEALASAHAEVARWKLAPQLV